MPVLENKSARKVQLSRTGHAPLTVEPFKSATFEGNVPEEWLESGILSAVAESTRDGLLARLWNGTAWIRLSAFAILLLGSSAVVQMLVLLPNGFTRIRNEGLSPIPSLLACLPGWFFLTHLALGSALNPTQIEARLSATSLATGTRGSSRHAGRELVSYFWIVVSAWALTAIFAGTVFPNTGTFWQLWRPDPKQGEQLMIHGVLGSYLLSLYVFRRGLLRESVTPAMFAHLLLRLVMTILVLSILHGTVESWTKTHHGLLGFALGFWPALGIEATAKAAGKALGLEKRLNARGGIPLEALPDTDHLLRTRLEEHGIETAGDLASVDDILTLIVRGRFSPERLIRALDQALLWSRLDASTLKELRARGISSASDLVALHRANEALQPAARVPEAWLGFAALLEEDPNVRSVLRWRAHSGYQLPVAMSVHDFDQDVADWWGRALLDGASSSKIAPIGSARPSSEHGSLSEPKAEPDSSLRSIPGAERLESRQ